MVYGVEGCTEVNAYREAGFAIVNGQEDDRGL